MNSRQVACNVINIFIHISTTSNFSHRFIVTDNAQHAKPKSSTLGSSPILNRKCAHLIRKKNCPPQILNDLSLLKYHPFASNFEHWNFTSNGAYLKKYILVQIIMLPLWFSKIPNYNFKQCQPHYVKLIKVWMHLKVDFMVNMWIVRYINQLEMY